MTSRAPLSSIGLAGLSQEKQIRVHAWPMKRVYAQVLVCALLPMKFFNSKQRVSRVARRETALPCMHHMHACKYQRARRSQPRAESSSYRRRKYRPSQLARRGLRCVYEAGSKEGRKESFRKQNVATQCTRATSASPSPTTHPLTSNAILHLCPDMAHTSHQRRRLHDDIAGVD